MAYNVVPEFILPKNIITFLDENFKYFIRSLLYFDLLLHFGFYIIHSCLGYSCIYVKIEKIQRRLARMEGCFIVITLCAIITL